MLKKIPYCDVVLMLVREDPGQTRTQIVQNAASLRTASTLLIKKPSAGLAVLRALLDMTTALEENAKRSLDDARDLGYVTADNQDRFCITQAGMAWLTSNSGL